MSRQLLPNIAPEASGANHQPQSPTHSNSSLSPPDGDVSSAGRDGVVDNIGISKVTYAKRGKITLVACVPCRKRKSKCDGKRPICSQCSARDGTCLYDMTDEQRKLTYLRDNVEQLQERSNSLQSLLHTVQSASDQEAAEVFRRLRSGVDIQVVAEQVQAGRLLYDVGHHHSDSVRHTTQDSSRSSQYEQLVNLLANVEQRASREIIRRLHNRVDIASILDDVHGGNLSPEPSIRRPPPDRENDYPNLGEGFGMIGVEELNHTSSRRPNGGFIDSYIGHVWTNVTKDLEFVEHLLNLYFTWQHAFFQNFPQNLFRADMAKGRTKYCSRALVNAICAAGCLLSNRERARQDRGDGQTMVASFYEEAEKHIGRDPTACVTTMAATYLLSYVDGTRGDLSSLWMLSGRSALITLDLGLHLRRPKRTELESAKEEDEYSKEELARSHAFWGCFHVDSITSFTLGRAPIFDSHSLTVGLPYVDPEEDEEPWQAYEMNLPNRPAARATTFYQCAKLSKIVNHTLMMFYAPRVPLSGALLLDEFEKYQEFFSQLPAIVSSTNNAPPHVICLHMYFHTAILSLFRPFLYAKILDSNIVPREICRTAANAISDLWQQYRDLYGLSGIYMFQVHCLLTACTIHIVNIPTISATRYLTHACNTLQDLAPRNDCARTALESLRHLAEKWSLVLPLDVEDALYREKDRSQLNRPDDVHQMRDHQMLNHSDRRYSSTGLPPVHGFNSWNIQPGLDRQLPSLPRPQSPQQQQQQQHHYKSRLEIDGNQIPTKRTPGFAPLVDGVDSTHQKRPRLENAPAQHSAVQRYRSQEDSRHSNHSSSRPILDSSSSSSQQYQQQSPLSASSYLYSPLAHQSVPLLLPVTSATSSSMTSSATTHASSTTSSMSRQRASSSSSSSGQKHGGGSSRSSGVDRIHHSREDSESAVRRVQDQVDGLSFAEDWRNPAVGIGILDGQRWGSRSGSDGRLS